MDKTGYIYIIREREFLKTKENIYKIGKTCNKEVKRLQSYPKGSRLICTFFVQDCHTVERDLISKFKIEFKQRKDIGTEYFEGDISKMRNLLWGEVKQEEPSFVWEISKFLVSSLSKLVFK
jgi:hypothetical protein